MIIQLKNFLKMSKFFKLFIVVIFIFTNLTNLLKADELKKLRKEHAKILKQTEKNWIGWRYFNTRLMFYTTHLVSYRCGIEEAFYGTSEDKIDRDLEIGKPDENYPDKSTVKIRKMVYEENPNGCDPEEPLVSSGLITFKYLDNVDEESDSLIGLDEETASIESIWIKLKYAYDKKFQKPMEFKIPKKVLRQIEADKS